jgi:CBS domain-containing protein
VITLPEAQFQDVFAALFLFRRYRIRHLVIVDEHNQLIGIVSSESIRRVLQPANLLKLRRVSEVMTTPVIHAPMTASVLSLARLMAQQRVSCIVITQANAQGGFQPVGIVTERDIVQFQTLQLNLANTLAQAVMSTPLFLLSPSDSLCKAHHEMQQRRVRRLVVSWNEGRELGIVTQTSLLRVFDPVEMYEVIAVLQQTVKQLEVEKSELLQSRNNQLNRRRKGNRKGTKKKASYNPYSILKIRQKADGRRQKE